MKKYLVKYNESFSTKEAPVIFQTDYYTIEVPTGWIIDSKNSEVIFSKGEKVFHIEAENGNTYCDSASKIITTRFGMHASTEGELEEEEINGWKKIKAVIIYELSVGLQEKGVEKEPDELHYIYTDSREIIVDIYMDNKWCEDQEAKAILDSFQIVELSKLGGNLN